MCMARPAHHWLIDVYAALRKPAFISSRCGPCTGCPIAFVGVNTENIMKPPLFRGKTKYSAITDLSESSQDDIPRKRTSLSTSSLFRADANFPLHSFASFPTIAAATSRPDTLGCGGIIRTKPVALSAFQAAPVEATETG